MEPLIEETEFVFDAGGFGETVGGNDGNEVSPGTEGWNVGAIVGAASHPHPPSVVVLVGSQYICGNEGLLEHVRSCSWQSLKVLQCHAVVAGVGAGAAMHWQILPSQARISPRAHINPSFWQSTVAVHAVGVGAGAGHVAVQQPQSL